MCGTVWFAPNGRIRSGTPSCRLSDELFVLGDSVILAVLGQLSFMPVLVLAARVCPEGVEATLFATLMSLLNTGSFAGSALGSVFTKSFGVTSDNFDNLAALVALCCALQLLPLPLLRFVPESLENRVKYVDNAGLVVEKKREKE